MQKVRMSRKGQVVIPAEIRRKLSLKHGEMVFVEKEREKQIETQGCNR